MSSSEVKLEEKKGGKKSKKEDEQIAKYRELLQSIQEKDDGRKKDKDMEMEITWVPGTVPSARHVAFIRVGMVVVILTCI